MLPKAPRPPAHARATSSTSLRCASPPPAARAIQLQTQPRGQILRSNFRPKPVVNSAVQLRDLTSGPASRTNFLRDPTSGSNFDIKFHGPTSRSNFRPNPVVQLRSPTSRFNSKSNFANQLRNPTSTHTCTHEKLSPFATEAMRLRRGKRHSRTQWVAALPAGGSPAAC